MMAAMMEQRPRRRTSLIPPMLVCAFALLHGLDQCAQAAPLVATGSAAPGFELPGVDGAVKLENYRGKLVYLDFWASWCAPCKRSFPWMASLQKQYGGAGLQVIAVNLDAKREDANTFLQNVPAGFTVAFDGAGKTAQQYGIKGMPSSALIGRDGRVLYTHTGFNDADKAALEAQVQAGLKQ